MRAAAAELFCGRISGEEQANMDRFLEAIRGGIIISCQASPGDPTYGPDYMVAFARSAQRGGAVGIRANGVEDVQAIKAATGLPLIGIWKRPSQDAHKVIITPTVDDALRLKTVGADVVAVDAGERLRPGGLDAATLIRRINDEVGIPVMADCADLESAVLAQQAGAILAATTLSDPSHLGPYDPDLTLLAKMVETLHIPVVAEGRFWDPADVEKAFGLGAHTIVIGSAATRPWLITERYVLASARARGR
jgi:N-acylglucosamine-6-phosphate 2-epimerase